ncbi:MAG: hypothetical protein PHS49_03870 [Candidatus Gracilibacteria bacterium]|nr:hypothetical protein [Candidatus Gracilibacteria bacterium]
MLENLYKGANKSGFETVNPEPYIIQDTKAKIIKAIQKRGLINQEEFEKIKNEKEAKMFMANLVHTGKITKDEYINIGIETGEMHIGNYLVLKGYISKEVFNKAIEKQKKEGKTRLLGQILIEDKDLYENENSKLTPNQLTIALKELGIIRLGEYLIYKGKLSKEKLDDYLKIQKIYNKPIGSILVNHNVITQAELNQIYIDLGIQLKVNDFGILLIDDNKNFGNNSDPWSKTYSI